MELKNFSYLFLLLLFLSVPLWQSFNKRWQYGQKIQYILPAILISAVFFILWDINFAAANIWTFNEQYTLGKTIKGLPIEEFLFFLVIPYGCFFIYEMVKAKLEKYQTDNVFLSISLVLIVGLAFVGYVFRHLTYTFMAFILPAIYLTYTVFRNKFKHHITQFYFTWFISLLPLLIMYGILAALPIVEYNTDHILNTRILQIPIENFPYFFLLLLMNITIYEFLKERKFY